MKKGTILIAFAVSACLAGCGPTKMSFDRKLVTGGDVRVGIAVIKPPTAGAYRYGNQGLLEIGITALIDARLNSRLKKLELTGFSALTDQFQEGLRRRRVDARVLPYQIDMSTIPRRMGEDGFTFPDFTGIRPKEKIDYLILLSVDGWGTVRQYFSVIPQGPPQAICMVRGEMIDLSNNKKVWKTEMTMQEASIPLDGSWDDPPDYPSLVAGIDKAVTRGKQFLFDEFFGTWLPDK